jgi:2,3-bisphosphoglycerate-dependent phosphoglycerate mutase
MNVTAMQKIFVVTHPQAQHHVQGLVGGWYDSHLTEKGKAAAQAIAGRLRSEIGDAEVHVYSSDLVRAMETATAIAQQFGTTARSMPQLRELSYGAAEGKPQSWLDERFVPAPDDDRLDHISCEGAESKRSFATRIYQAMEQIIQDPVGTKVISTHGYAMTFVVAAWIRMPLEASGHVNVRASSGGITLLLEDDFLRNRVLQYVNDTSHLK